MVQRAEHRGERRRYQDHRLVQYGDLNQCENRPASIVDDEPPSPVDPVTKPSGRHRGQSSGDSLYQQPQSDELDREPGGQEVEVEDDFPCPVDDVHAEDVQQIEPGVAAEKPHRGDVSAQSGQLFERLCLLHAITIELEARTKSRVLIATEKQSSDRARIPLPPPRRPTVVFLCARSTWRPIRPWSARR